MEQRTIEKCLTVAYALCVAFGAISSVTIGIAWGHWKETLDQCQIGMNCSCILYGRHTPTLFLGGYMGPCIWVTFGPLFYIFFSFCLTCFHGYRVLFFFKETRTRTVMTKNDSGETIEMHAVQTDDANPLPKAFWVTVSVFSVFWTIYGVVHFAIFLDGFYKTCNQYRFTLENLLRVGGTAIPVIYGRLSCQGVFDFMDYMQPDSGNAYREGFINTGLDLILGISASCLAWILFIFESYLNIKMASQS